MWFDLWFLNNAPFSSDGLRLSYRLHHGIPLGIHFCGSSYWQEFRGAFPGPWKSSFRDFRVRVVLID